MQMPRSHLPDRDSASNFAVMSILWFQADREGCQEAQHVRRYSALPMQGMFQTILGQHWIREDESLSADRYFEYAALL